MKHSVSGPLVVRRLFTSVHRLSLTAREYRQRWCFL